jgi:hypothetical protein
MRPTTGEKHPPPHRQEPIPDAPPDPVPPELPPFEPPPGEPLDDPD